MEIFKGQNLIEFRSSFNFMFDRDKKLVQLVKVSEPKKSFGVHDKGDIVNYLKNHYH